MRQMKRHLALLALVLGAVVIIGSCKSMSRADLTAEMDSWVGQTKQALVEKWGKPAETRSDLHGGEIVKYYRLAGGYATINPNEKINGRNKYRNVIVQTLYINKDGIIYRAFWRQS